MQPIVNIAIRAARAAATVIMRSLDNLEHIRVMEKNPNDFVTEIDRLAENKIIEIIRKAYPMHGILAEESGDLTKPNDEIIWIIDPIDGTRNFLHGFPHFSISIAISYKKRIEHGVIYDPIRNDLFVASRGEGARCNDRRMRVSKQAQLTSSLVGTGFPYKKQVPIEVYLKGFKELTDRMVNLRRAGSAALDLAYVAAGYLDAFWEYSLQPWDIAAGALMIQEAGGVVTDFNGGDNFLEQGNVIACNSKMYKEFFQTLKPFL